MKLHERLRCIVRLQATATIKAVLVALAYHADEQGRCWPSQELLADEAGTTPRTVRRVIRQLHRAGLLTSSRRFNQSTIYAVQFDADTVSALTGRSVRMNSPRTLRKRKLPTHAAGFSICRKCLKHPSANGGDGPCLTCIRKDKQADQTHIQQH